MDSQQFLTRFVKIVEQHPVLYDPKLPQRTPHQCSLTWETVAEQVRNELHEQCSVEELKTKWKGIRSSFSRFKRKLQQNRDKDGWTKQYYLYDSLKFLHPYTRTKRRYSEAIDDLSSDAEEWDPEITAHIFNNDDIIDQTNSSTSDPMALPLHSKCLVYPEVKIEPIDDDNAVDITNGTHEPLQETNTTLNRKDINPCESTPSKEQKDEENSDLQFFRSILPDIEHFTKLEKRKLKVGIFKLIDDIETNRRDVRCNHKQYDKIKSVFPM